MDPENRLPSSPCMGRRRRQRDPSRGVMLHATNQAPVQAESTERAPTILTKVVGLTEIKSVLSLAMWSALVVGKK